MSLQEHVYKLLIISSSDGFSKAVKATLPKLRFQEIVTVTGETAARRLLSDYHFDLVIIHSPLPEDTGIRLAVDLCSDKTTTALLVVASDLYHGIYREVSPRGVMVASRPLPRNILLQAVDDMCAYSERLGRLAKTSTSLESKMKEIRIVNRAKWILIDQEGMPEQEAHRFIEKSAMDTGKTKSEIAEEIISKYNQ